MVVKVKEVSENEWLMEVASEDKKKIASIVQKLETLTCPLPKYGLWREIGSEKIWKELLIEFCVMGSAEPIERLAKDNRRYDAFIESLSLETLLSIEANRQDYISKQLKHYKATRFHNRNADRIADCLTNEEIVKDGEIVLFEELVRSEIVDEDQMREFLLRKLPFFKIKSVSDFMISIGAARGVIALDTRIVGLLHKHFGLTMINRKSEEIDDPIRIRDKIQWNKRLYKQIEGKLREVCEEIGIDLSLLDRILFRFSNKSTIEYILEVEVWPFLVWKQ